MWLGMRACGLKHRVWQVYVCGGVVQNLATRYCAIFDMQTQQWSPMDCLPIGLRSTRLAPPPQIPRRRLSLLYHASRRLVVCSGGPYWQPWTEHASARCCHGRRCSLSSAANADCSMRCTTWGQDCGALVQTSSPFLAAATLPSAKAHRALRINASFCLEGKPGSPAAMDSRQMVSTTRLVTPAVVFF